MKRLVLLRHGESVWNKENRFTGWKDVDLTEEGIFEAHRAGAMLEDRVGGGDGDDGRRVDGDELADDELRDAGAGQHREYHALERREAGGDGGHSGDETEGDHAEERGHRLEGPGEELLSR